MEDNKEALLKKDTDNDIEELQPFDEDMPVYDVDPPDQEVSYDPSNSAVTVAVGSEYDSSDVPASVVSSDAIVLTHQWDKDALIEDATLNYIKNLSADGKKPSDYTVSQLRFGLIDAINNAFIEANQKATTPGKLAYLTSLPNSCIASLMLYKYHVRCISWTGRRDDGNYPAIYQESGSERGIYVGAYDCFIRWVKEFKYTCTMQDVKEVMHILEATAEFTMPSCDRDLIALDNGIFNYKTKTFMDFTPDICFMRKSRVRYVTGPAPTNPHIMMPDGEDWNFDDWMNTLSDDPEIVDLLWKCLGTVIRPNVRWDKLICMYSQVGMNGKGTLCQLMKLLCGEGSYATISFSEFEKDSYLNQLLTANAVITDENATNDYSRNVSKLKAVVTGDSISIDRKYKDSITFVYRGIIVQCVNSLPRAADQTDSFYRRFLMIPFEKTFQGAERKYIKSQYLHRPDVLEYVLWKVLNMPDYYELPEPEACKALLSTYKQYNDPVLQFVDEVFPEFAWNKVPASFVYDLYLEWCKHNNPSGKAIGKHSILDKIKYYISNAYSDTWMYNDGTVNICKDDNQQPEHMIFDYHLDKWVNGAYKGTDIEKLCKPVFKTTYKRVFIKY